MEPWLFLGESMAGKAVEILLKAKDFASAQIAKVNERVRAIGPASDSSVAGNERLSSSFSTLTSRIGAFIGATAGFIAVKGFFEGVINTGSKFETLQTQIDAVTGSAKAGEEAFSWIKQFAKDTPFQLDEVATSFIKLKAFGLDPLDGTFQKLVDQSSKLGGGQEKLNGIIIAVGQAWAKQKLQAEETLQLVERGVPVYDLLSKALSKTTAEIQQMSFDGELGRDAIKALIDEMGSSSLGAAAAQMENASSVVSNLKDQITEFFAEISDQGALEYFKSQLKELSSTIKQMVADGSLKEFAKDIADGMISMAKAIKTTVSTVVSFTSEIKSMVAAFITVKFVQYTAAFFQIAKAITAAKFAQIGLNIAMRANPIGLLVTAIGALYIGIEALVNKYFDWSTSAERAARDQQLVADQAEAAAEKYRALTEQLGLQITSEEDLKAAVDAGLISLNQKTQEYERVKTAAELATLAQNNYVSALTGVTAEINLQANQMVAGAFAGQQFKAKLDEMTASSQGLAGSLSSMSSGVFAEFMAASEEMLAGNFLTDLETADLKLVLMSESFKRLGVDTELLQSGLTSAGLAAVKTFAFIANQAEATGDVLLLSIDAALTKIKNNRGIDAITAEVVKLANTGRYTSDQILAMMSKIDAAAEKLIKPIKEINNLLSNLGKDIGAADTVEALEDLSIAATDAFSQGKITAEEYNDLIEAIQNRLADVNALLERQIQLQQQLNGENADGDEQQDDAERNHHREREKSIQITGRLGEATAKALDISNKARVGTILGVQAIRQYFAGVNTLAARLLEASENADKFADSVLNTVDSGNASEQQMAGYVKRLEQMIAGGKNLDNQSLSKLQNALSAAKSKMAALKDETKSAQDVIAGLAGELAGLEGDQLKVQAIEAQQRRLDLEGKIAQAQAEGNAEAVASYNKALSLLDKINAKKKQQIIVQQQADAQQNNQQQQSSTKQNGSSPISSSTSNGAQAIPSGRTVSISFVDPKGETVTGVFPERDENKMIDIFRKSGAVTR